MKEKIKVIFNKVFSYVKYGFAVYIMIWSSITFGMLYFLLQGCSLVFPDGDVLDGINNLNVQVYQESVVN